jgi:hypothetical protein
MQKPNDIGVYEPEIIEELARRGRFYISVEIAQCEDGLYRYALDMMYSYGGFGGPITDRATGYTSPAAAKEAAINELLRRFPKAWGSEPASVHEELRDLKAQVEAGFREPSLF